MAQTNVNIRMDSDLKIQFEAFCTDMGGLAAFEYGTGDPIGIKVEGNFQILKIHGQVGLDIYDHLLDGGAHSAHKNLLYLQMVLGRQ